MSESVTQKTVLQLLSAAIFRRFACVLRFA